MIREALKQELLAEFRAIPPIEELKKMYTFSERHERQMAALFAELREQERREAKWLKVRRVAIIVIAILAFALASVKFVPEVYAYVKEWWMELADDESIEFRGSSKERNIEVGEELRFELGYVPEGYELEREEYYETGVQRILYKNSEGKPLRLSIRKTTTVDLVSLNTENILVEEKDINNTRYFIFESRERGTIVLWECGAYMVKIEALMEMDEVLNMAISVIMIEGK